MERRGSIDITPRNAGAQGWLSGLAVRIDPPLRVFLAGLLVWTALASYLRRAFPGDFVDDGQYLVAARSICDGDGYRLPSRVGNPVATKYPVGTSAIAAMVMALLPGSKSTSHDWAAGRIVVILAGLGLAETSRRFFLGTGFSAWSASLFALAMIWHPGTLLLASTLMSDLIFAFLTLVVLVRWMAHSRDESNRVFPWFIDGLLVGSAFLVRSNGVTLVLTSLGACLVPGRARIPKLATTVVGIGLVWIPSTLLVHTQAGPRDSGNYASELTAAYEAGDHFWSIPWTNLSRIPLVFTSVIFSPLAWNWRVVPMLARWPVVASLIEIGLGAAIVGGAVVLWRRGAWPRSIWLNAGLTILLFMLWHSPFDFRFGLPLNPLILSMFAAGVGITGRQAAYGPLVGSLALAASLITVAETSVRALRHHGVMGVGHRLEDPAIFEIIRAKLPLNAVVICGLPEMTYLNTGRVGVPLRDNDLYFGDKPPEWARIEARLTLDPGRPVYLLDNPGGPDKGLTQWVAYLARENHLKIKAIPGTKERLWRLESSDRTTPSIDSEHSGQ